MNDPAGIKRRYRTFADMECRGYSEAYYQLALAVAEDDDVVGFLSQMREVQPNLFFASVQLLAGRDPMPSTGPELRQFLRRRGGEVGDVMRSRRTQTNEVGRCAVLLPALPPGPLALIEVGASAGLCLLLDQFYYELEPMPLGEVSSPVHLRCALAGPVPMPPEIPAIVWRRGLDLHPVDVHDEDAVRWLMACVWPDHHERRRRLEGAIELAREQPPDIRAGDLVEDLPALLAEASSRRDVVWVSNEGAGIIGELAILVPPPSELRFLLGRTRFTNGERHDELLGIAHPHGAALTWLEPRTVAERFG